MRETERRGHLSALSAAQHIDIEADVTRRDKSETDRQTDERTDGRTVGGLSTHLSCFLRC